MDTTFLAADLDRLRPRLFGIAYRMLGDIQDAEDAVQDAFLRWQQAPKDSLWSPDAWLVSVVTRLAIDRLRRAKTERAAYTGPWLPEPVTSERIATDRSAEVSSDMSMVAADDKEAMLAVLAPDVTFRSDGGGKITAARRVVHSADRVARLLLGLENKYRGVQTYSVGHFNGRRARLRGRSRHFRHVLRNRRRTHCRRLSRAEP